MGSPISEESKTTLRVLSYSLRRLREVVPFCYIKRVQVKNRMFIEGSVGRDNIIHAGGVQRICE
jgi:hypothetical protein